MLSAMLLIITHEIEVPDDQALAIATAGVTSTCNDVGAAVEAAGGITQRVRYSLSGEVTNPLPPG